MCCPRWYKQWLAPSSKKEMDMNKVMIAFALVVLATPAVAASARYYLEMDTVGNCSVVDSKPSEHAGMTILGDKNGFASKEDAAKALKGLPKDKCKGIVG
jgi:hypothetical protein